MEENWKELTEFYHKHLLGPYVYNRIKTIKDNGHVSPEALDQFKKEHYATVVSNLAKLFAATRIFQELQKESIIVVPLKGIALLETAYKDISARPMTDIDILIKPKDIQKAKIVLKHLGYQYFDSYRGSYNFNDSKNRVMIDVHSKFTRYEQLFKFNYKEIYERLTQIAFNDKVQVHVLCPEHQIVHIALHLAPGLYSDYNLINFLDLYKLISEYSIDWEYLVEFAKRTKTASYLYAPIYYSTKLFDIKIPEFVLGQLDEKLSQKKIQYVHNQYLTTVLNGGFEGYKNFLKRLLWAEGLPERLKLLRMGLFPDRKEMAQRYSVSENSLNIYSLYMNRLLKMFKQGGRK